jgi:hypothetical protein
VNLLKIYFQGVGVVLMAKIRMDFVTNSSSSSYIIALRNDYTSDEIKNILLEKYKDRIQDGIDDYNSYDDENYDFEGIVQKLVDEFINVCEYGINIDNWKVSATEYCNENGLIDGIIYGYLGEIDSEKFKLGEGYN